MINDMRQAKTFTIGKDILAEIADSKGSASTSERVNELLRRALELERHEKLEQEAAEFFSTESGADSARERAAYRKASRRVLSRD